MQQLAAYNDGKCLSRAYINNRLKLKWRCIKGHIWEAPANSIQQGHWCPACAGRPKINIEDMRNLAECKGGKCLTESYVNAHTHLKWQCKNGHVWKATSNNIRRGKWCPICGIESRAQKQRSGIDEMQSIAKERDGKCLSEKYINTATKLKWMCSKGHTWEAVPDAVKRGTWCPACNTSIAESFCRLFFETLFEQHFPSSWPNWLRNKTGQVMQLDGYCEPLGIAFEYQGIQHYGSDEYFNQKSSHSFKKRQEDDERKKELCRDHGIKLFVIPYLILKKTTIEEKVESLRKFVKREAMSFGISIPNNIGLILIDVNQIYTNNEIQKIISCISSFGGKLLEGQYEGSKSRFKVKCSKGHIWFARADHLKRGVWCPVCAGNVRSNVEEMRRIARKKGGECLSKEYAGNNNKLLWRCNGGHEWEATPGHIKSGTWCPVCAGNRRKSIGIFKELARERNGECLSGKYVSIATKLKWRCVKGHDWTATPNSVKKGSWCPHCSGNIKLTLEELKILAQDRGGECLSKEYHNNHTKLRWRCREGHEWAATPAHVKNATWCPICAKNVRKSKLILTTVSARPGITLGGLARSSPRRIMQSLMNISPDNRQY